MADNPNSLKIKADNKNVVIRMYNIGFGDCFLLLIPTIEGTKKVLVDCGVTSGHNPDSKLTDVINQVMADITDNGVPRIDIVIATHRHQDHVCGFEKKDWEKVEVGEVWMPWTENYNDPKAVEILNKQSKAAEKVKKSLDLMIDKSRNFGFSAQKVADLKMIKDFAENSLTNKKAMDTLHHGFKDGDNTKRRYLPFEDRKLNKHQSKLLPGVTVHLMGPSRDENVISSMEPIKSEQWFRLIDEIGTDDLKTQLPFHMDWAKIPSNTELKIYRETAQEQKKLNELFEKIRNINEGAEFNIAASIEGAVNGTSLMLMIEIGKAFLFFPGDAQNGTWKMALQDEEWRELLTKTNFYKVGHHGSHNATPKEFVFDILQPKETVNNVTKSKFKAMASVYPVPKFSKIPKTALINALLEKSEDVVRSDEEITNHLANPTIFTRKTHFVETKVPI